MPTVNHCRYSSQYVVSPHMLNKAALGKRTHWSHSPVFRRRPPNCFHVCYQTKLLIHNYDAQRDRDALQQHTSWHMPTRFLSPVFVFQFSFKATSFFQLSLGVIPDGSTCNKILSLDEIIRLVLLQQSCSLLQTAPTFSRSALTKSRSVMSKYTVF